MCLLVYVGAGPFSAPAGPVQAPTGPGVDSPDSRSPPLVVCSGQPGGSAQRNKDNIKFTIRLYGEFGLQKVNHKEKLRVEVLLNNAKNMKATLQLQHCMRIMCNNTFPPWPSSYITEGGRAESTYRNQHAVEVSVVFLVPVGIHGTQQLLEPLDSGDSQDGNAAVAAEGLQQGEVDLQRHVVCVVSSVSCQDAQDHAVWVSGGGRSK